MNKLVQKIRCFFGKHNWQFTIYPTRHGIAVGNRCCKCGRWSKERICKELPLEETYLSEVDH